MDNVIFKFDKKFMFNRWDKQIYRYYLEKGSITMLPKPPGGHSLNGFLEFLKSQNIVVLVSLLEYDEMERFGLMDEALFCKKYSIDFINFPIQDHDVPKDFTAFNQLVNKLSNELLEGNNIAVHCYAGIGRTGITAASIMIKQGMAVEKIVTDLSQVRGIKVPETMEQESWLHNYAEELQQ